MDSEANCCLMQLLLRGDQVSEMKAADIFTLLTYISLKYPVLLSMKNL